MSSITTESDTVPAVSRSTSLHVADGGVPAVSRSTSLRAADGVIAGYIHSLAHAASESSSAAAAACLGRPAVHVREWRAGRAGGHAKRRHHARRRVAATA